MSGPWMCSHVNWRVYATKSYQSDDWDWIRFFVRCECGLVGRFSRRVVELTVLGMPIEWIAAPAPAAVREGEGDE